jgi:hypothetical protein
MVWVRRVLTERSTRRTGVYVSQAWTGSNLVDMGRERCALVGNGGELSGRPSAVCPETTVTCCGVAVVMPQGPSRTPPSSSENTVNTGIVPVLPAAAHPARLVGLGASTADRSETGRSRRSTPSRGKPAHMGKGGSGIEKEWTLQAARRAAEWQRPGRGFSRDPGSGDAGQASPLGGGRCRSPVR